MTFWMQFLLVMVVVCLADVCWTKFIIESANKEAMKSAVWSSLIILCGAFSTLSFVDDKRFVLAGMIGAFIGTYVTVRWSKK